MRKKLHLFTFYFAGWPASRTRARTSPTSHNLIRSFDSSSGSCSTTSLKAYAKQASKSTSIQVSFFWHLLTIVKIAQNHPNPSRCTKVKCFMQWWYFWNATKNYSILNKAVKDDIFNWRLLAHIEDLKHSEMLDPFGQAWQNGSALAA